MTDDLDKQNLQAEEAPPQSDNTPDAPAAPEPADYRMPRRRKLEVGEIIEGKVVMIGDSHVFLDVGSKSEATLDIKEARDEDDQLTVEVGDTIQAYIVATEPEVVLSRALARGHLNLDRLEDAHDMGIPVEGKVTGTNKGGFDVDLGGARAFCPVSQIQLGYCDDPSHYVGQTLEFRVIEFAEEGKRVVVSRRALLEEQREEQASEVMSQLVEGAELEGQVASLQPYGAFVELGGNIQGLVHISEISHGRVEHPDEVLRMGQKVQVKVLRVEPDPKNPKRQKIGLSIKALLGDPWDDAASQLYEGSTVTGKVVRLQPYGAFVELFPGVDGLVHISELSNQRVRHPSDVVSEGQSITVTVLKIDHRSHRISLSMVDHSASSADDELVVGSVVEAVVNRIKPFGLLVQIKGAGRDARGLIPAEETGTGKGANLRKAFPEGAEVKAMIISVEPDTGRMKLSISAVANEQERADYQEFVGDGRGERREDRRSGEPAPSFGTFGDLLNLQLDEGRAAKGEGRKGRRGKGKRRH
jgi:small subunit ribosomal protein S1